MYEKEDFCVFLSHFYSAFIFTIIIVTIIIIIYSAKRVIFSKVNGVKNMVKSELTINTFVR